MIEAHILEKLNELKNLIQNNLSDRWLNIGEVSKKTGKNLFRISWIDQWLQNG